MTKSTTATKAADTDRAALAVQGFIESLKGGKASRKGDGYGNRYGNNDRRGQGRGDGKNFKNKKGRDGNRNGGIWNSCEDQSQCYKALPGRKGNREDQETETPLAYTGVVMQHNFKVAKRNIAWLNLAVTGIDVDVLERCRDNATQCVPRGVERKVNEILLIEKSLRASIKDIVMDIKGMSMSLNVDPLSFTDEYNKIVTDPDVMTKLLLDGHLSYGGTILHGVLINENRNFRHRIRRENKAKVAPAFNRLTYGSVDQLFAATYDTDKGSYDIIFGLGLDGLPVEPHTVDRDVGVRDIDLLTPVDATEFFRRASVGSRDDSQSRSRSSRRSVSSTLLT